MIKKKLKVLTFRFCVFCVFCLFFLAKTAYADTIFLLPPSLNKSISIEEALSNRKSVKSYLGRKLRKQDLAQILWAASGVNRPNEGKRTHPSPMAKYNVKVYVCVDESVFMYLPIPHRLQYVGSSKIEGIDVRTILPSKDYSKEAPVQLVFVGDISALPAKFNPSLRWNWVYCEVGTMIQNLYLQCTALGLGTCVNAGFDSNIAKQYLKLSSSQKVLFVAPVGYEDRQ